MNEFEHCKNCLVVFNKKIDQCPVCLVSRKTLEITAEKKQIGILRRNTMLRGEQARLKINICALETTIIDLDRKIRDKELRLQKTKNEYWDYAPKKHD